MALNNGCRRRKDVGGNGGAEVFQHDPHWRDIILICEYFHDDNGAGFDASHLTGWTGLVAKLLLQSGE